MCDRNAFVSCQFISLIQAAREAGNKIPTLIVLVQLKLCFQGRREWMYGMGSVSHKVMVLGISACDRVNTQWAKLGSQLVWGERG
jgi:hypothetical protein